MSDRRHGLTIAALALLAACADRSPAAPGAGGRLVVTPDFINCSAGERVDVAATIEDGPPSAIEFEVGGDGVWLADVQRERGTASLACEAAALGVLRVRASARPAIEAVLVPALVRAPAAGTVQLTVSPAALTFVSGSIDYLRPTVTTTIPGVSRGARFATADTAVAVVDSVAGTVRAVAPGTTSIVVRAHADPSVRQTVPVTVTRGSLLVSGIAATPALSIRVGDSTRVTATIFLAAGAPPGTSRAATFVSANQNIVRVSPDGTVVRGVAPGTTVIVAAAAASPALRTTIPVTVREPVP